MTDERLRFFAVTLPGLEPLVVAELRQLNIASEIPKRIEKVNGKASEIEEGGGVEFQGSLRELYLANLHLRTASRILVRVGEFYAAAFSELCKKAGRLPWERYVQPGSAINVRVTCHKSRLYHSDAVAERVMGAIGDRLGRTVEAAQLASGEENIPGQVVVVRLSHDLCTISVCSSGDLLHRRGYRKATAKAPIRETLAAGMLLASGWDLQSPLIDPFCGSGTIAIEGAMLAAHYPPGQHRNFAFMDWPGYDRLLWEGLLAEVKNHIIDNIPQVAASDRDAGAIRAAMANAERAGVGKWIDFSCRAISDLAPSGSGWIVTNPPYGVRIKSNADLRNLYSRFGDVLRQKCQGWNFGILCSDVQLLRCTKLNFEISMSLVNGGIPVLFVRGKV